MLNTKTKQIDNVGQAALALIVDDEDSIGVTLSNVLEDEGFRTLRAASGPEALEIVRQLDPAVVFLDIWLPGWDGIETLEKIKAASPHTEVVMISGHASIANALEATKRGALDFIEKPLDIESIMHAATRALERREELSLAAESGTGPAEAKIRPFRADHARSALTHAGVTSKARAGRNVGQRTLKASAVVYGQGLHSGQKSGLVLEPLPLNSGIHFGRIGSSKTVPAYVDFVDSTNFATTIRSNGASAATIEHLMSALHAYKISNLLIKCNHEVPILDGSALEFCRLIDDVGVEEQGGEWYEITLDSRLEVSIEGKNGGPAETIVLEPSDNFIISYELEYPYPVGKQYFEFTLDAIASFKEQIAPARTFGFVRDVEKLQRAGLAAGGRLDNFVLIGRERIINTDLRFEEEPVRHKILDIIGDLFLLGRPLCVKVSARMTGHSDNVKVLIALKELMDRANQQRENHTL